MSSSSPLRIGIISTAKIARNFTQGVRASKRLVVASVASRERNRAQQFAAEFGIARHYGSYEELLADPDIDAVYNPLPNSMHAEWSIRAARAGKHVLCEKPLTATAQQAREVLQAAREHGVHIVEAYPYRSQPLNQRLKALLQAGTIGELRLIQASFGFTMTDKKNIRLDPAMAGGSLGDAGCYPVSLIRMIAGCRPTRVRAEAAWAATGVDQSVVGTMEFPTGVFAQVSCSFATAVHRNARIIGANGIIETNYPNTPPAGRPATMLLKRGSGWDAVEEIIEEPAVNGFLAEAESFCDMLRSGTDKWNGASNEESLDIMLMLDAILASAKSGLAVNVGAP